MTCVGAHENFRSSDSKSFGLDLTDSSSYLCSRSPHEQHDPSTSVGVCTLKDQTKEKCTNYCMYTVHLQILDLISYKTMEYRQWYSKVLVYQTLYPNTFFKDNTVGHSLAFEQSVWLESASGHQQECTL